MTKLKWYNFIKYLTYLMIVAFGLWLINLNFPLNSKRVVWLNFNQDLPIVSRLGPTDRVKSSAEAAVILANPVYFDLRILPWFNQAKITLVYASAGRQLEGMGFQTGPGFSFSVVKAISERKVDEQNNESIFLFDLNKVYTQRNVSRFLIATQTLDEDDLAEMTIKSLKIELIR